MKDGQGLTFGLVGEMHRIDGSKKETTLTKEKSCLMARFIVMSHRLASRVKMYIILEASSIMENRKTLDCGENFMTLSTLHKLNSQVFLAYGLQGSKGMNSNKRRLAP